MDIRNFLARSMRAGGHLLPIALFSLALGLPAASYAAPCDITGFDKPCSVRDGVYRILVPEGDGPFPAMMYLYGSGGQSASIANHPLFIDSVVERGYALIVPAALNMEYRRGSYDSGWGLRHEPGGTRDEVLFIKRVIDDASRRFSVDPKQVVLVGQSRGAFLTWEIACHEPDTAAAYAVHAGGYLGKLPAECERPIRFMHSHGISDPIVPFAGTPLVSGGVAMATLESSLDLLARTNRCQDPNPEVTEMMLGLQRTRWTKCAPGSSLDLLLHGGGHTMPSEWFRAVLDWFEEPPAEIEDNKPSIRTVGVRLQGQFKAVPSGGTGLNTTQQATEGKRLQAPTGSKKASE